METVLFELGVVTIRNAANYYSVLDAWWPKERCGVCNCVLNHPYYIGYMMCYVRQEQCVKLMGPNYFCSDCELDSRAIASVFAEWEILALDEAEWLDSLKEPGFLAQRQVYYHCTNWCRTRFSTFVDTYTAKRGALRARMIVPR